ncbi:MAG: hypothetical protein K2V38_05455 [Gemmataceae bacterium]|nr:hypothetical protein [Gemmataceae bacterium]
MGRTKPRGRRRARGRSFRHEYGHPSGAVLVVDFVCGRRYYLCPFPEVAARYDGAGDDEAADAVDLFERLAAERARGRTGAT